MISTFVLPLQLLEGGRALFLGIRDLCPHLDWGTERRTDQHEQCGASQETGHDPLRSPNTPSSTSVVKATEPPAARVSSCCQAVILAPEDASLASAWGVSISVSTPSPAISISATISG